MKIAFTLNPGEAGDLKNAMGRCKKKITVRQYVCAAIQVMNWMVWHLSNDRRIIAVDDDTDGVGEIGFDAVKGEIHERH